MSEASFKKLHQMVKAGDKLAMPDDVALLVGEAHFGDCRATVNCLHPGIPARTVHKSTGFFVDVFLYSESNDRVKWGADCYGMKPEIEREGLPRDWIFPLKRMDFEGLSVSTPNQPKKYLEVAYGSDWETPRPKGDMWPLKFSSEHSGQPWD